MEIQNLGIDGPYLIKPNIFKDEWIGSINPYSNYSNIDMYDSSFDEGGLITMLNYDGEWIKEEYVKDENEEDGFKKDENGERIIDVEKSIPGPHPGKKYSTLEEYFKDFPNKNIMLFASLQDLNGDIREKTKPLKVKYPKFFQYAKNKKSNFNYQLYKNVLQKRGWCWGGNWGSSIFDPMHFEYPTNGKCGYIAKTFNC